MCTPLALATDSLILLVSFCLRMPVHPWMFCAYLIIWIVLHYCIDLYACIYPYRLQWVRVIAILSTFLSACVVIVLLNCIDLYYWIALYYCYLHIPLSLQWVPVYISSPHPHACLCVCLFLAGRTIYFVLILCIITCILPLTLTFIVDTLSASTIVEGSRPCPHPYKYLLSWGKFGLCLLLLIDCRMILM